MQNTTSLTGYPWHSVHLVWAEARETLRRVIEREDTGYTVDDVYSALMARQMQLWMADNNVALVTSVIVKPQWKALKVEFLAGDTGAAQFKSIMDDLAEYATQVGCKYLLAEGRPGWERVARDSGAQVTRKAYLEYDLWEAKADQAQPNQTTRGPASSRI